jgi:uncharacterized protein (TIGR03086 family)
MSSPGGWAEPQPAGPALLERAVGYTRTSLSLVTPGHLGAPTPCAGWDLLSLLTHMDDSLAAFTDAAEIGYVDLVPVRTAETRAEAGRLVVARLRRRACAVLGAWAGHPGTGAVAVADRVVAADLLAAAGALEVAVHGWDVARACGVDRPLPPALALALLDTLPLLVADADRPRRFASPVAVPVAAPPGDRLLAALGRSPSTGRRG